MDRNLAVRRRPNEGWDELPEECVQRGPIHIDRGGLEGGEQSRTLRLAERRILRHAQDLRVVCLVNGGSLFPQVLFELLARTEARINDRHLLRRRAG